MSDQVIDYLNKPPQRFNLIAARNERGIIEEPLADGKWVKFDDMDLFMFEGGELMKKLLAKQQDLQRAALEVLRVYMPQFPNSLAVDDCLVALAAATTATAPPQPYWVRTFWSPDRKHLVTVHVTGAQDVNIIGFQDDNGDEWEPASPQQNMTEASEAGEPK